MLAFLLIPLAFALGVTTQGSHATSTVPATAAAAVDTAHVVLEFENQSLDLATVYAVRESGQYARLGQVSANSSERLVIPRSVVSGSTMIRLVARPLAGRARPNSGSFAVQPGDHIAAALSPTLNTISVLPARE